MVIIGTATAGIFNTKMKQDFNGIIYGKIDIRIRISFMFNILHAIQGAANESNT